jgi:hypothetical protein
MKKIIIVLALISIVWYFGGNNTREVKVEDVVVPEKTADTTTSTGSNINISPASPPKNSQTVSSTVQLTNGGRIVFGITDKAVGLDAYKSIFLTIGSVRIHHPSKGWITVSETPRTFDLLKLRAKSRNELLADMNITADTYDSVRLGIDSILITDHAGKVTEAKLPSKELKIDSNVRVFKGKISSVLIDFLADKSMHMTGDGKIIFAPVVAVETKSEMTVQITPVEGSLNKKVDLIGGTTNFTATLGMNEAGVVKIDTIIDPLATLEIIGDTIKLTPKK